MFAGIPTRKRKEHKKDSVLISPTVQSVPTAPSIINNSSILDRTFDKGTEKAIERVVSPTPPVIIKEEFVSMKAIVPISHPISNSSPYSPSRIAIIVKEEIVQDSLNSWNEGLELDFDGLEFEIEGGSIGMDVAGADVVFADDDFVEFVSDAKEPVSEACVSSDQLATEALEPISEDHVSEPYSHHNDIPFEYKQEDHIQQQYTAEEYSERNYTEAEFTQQDYGNLNNTQTALTGHGESHAYYTQEQYGEQDYQQQYEEQEYKDGEYFEGHNNEVEYTQQEVPYQGQTYEQYDYQDSQAEYRQPEYTYEGYSQANANEDGYTREEEPVQVEYTQAEYTQEGYNQLDNTGQDYTQEEYVKEEQIGKDTTQDGFESQGYAPVEPMLEYIEQEYEQQEYKVAEHVQQEHIEQEYSRQEKMTRDKTQQEYTAANNGQQVYTESHEKYPSQDYADDGYTGDEVFAEEEYIEEIYVQDSSVEQKHTNLEEYAVADVKNINIQTRQPTMQEYGDDDKDFNHSTGQNKTNRSPIGQLYSEQDNSTQEYTEQAPTGQIYSEQDFNTQDYTEQEYTEQEYADQAPTGQLYSEQNYNTQEYTEQAPTGTIYSEQDYNTQEYTEQEYAEQAQTGQIFPEQDYNTQEYTKQEYTEQDYTEQDYTEQEYKLPDFTLSNKHLEPSIAGKRVVQRENGRGMQAGSRTHKIGRFGPISTFIFGGRLLTTQIHAPSLVYCVSVGSIVEREEFEGMDVEPVSVRSVFGVLDGLFPVVSSEFGSQRQEGEYLVCEYLGLYRRSREEVPGQVINLLRRTVQHVPKSEIERLLVEGKRDEGVQRAIDEGEWVVGIAVGGLKAVVREYLSSTPATTTRTALSVSMKCMLALLTGSEVVDLLDASVVAAEWKCILVLVLQYASIQQSQGLLAYLSSVLDRHLKHYESLFVQMLAGQRIGRIQGLRGLRGYRIVECFQVLGGSVDPGVAADFVALLLDYGHIQAATLYLTQSPLESDVLDRLQNSFPTVDKGKSWFTGLQDRMKGGGLRGGIERMMMSAVGVEEEVGSEGSLYPVPRSEASNDPNLTPFVYQEDYPKEHSKDYTKDYSKDYTQDYQKEYTEDHTQEYQKEYTQEYTEEYTQEYTQEYQKDYTEEYTGEYQEEYQKDYQGEYQGEYQEVYQEVYSEEYKKGYEEEHQKEYTEEYQEETKDEYKKGYTEDYAKEAKEETKEYPNEYAKEYPNEYANEKTKEYTKEEIKETKQTEEDLGFGNKKDIQKDKAKPPEKAPKGFFGSVLSIFRAEKAHLPSGTSFYYDSDLKKWVNKTGASDGVKEDLSAPPIPKTLVNSNTPLDMSTVAIKKGKKKSTRSRYIDITNPDSLTNPTLISTFTSNYNTVATNMYIPVIPVGDQEIKPVLEEIQHVAKKVEVVENIVKVGRKGRSQGPPPEM